MSNHFSMGAINKTTNKYEYPKIANKINKYKCPFCEKDVIFRNGKIKKPHFAHYKSENPCSYYEKPNETQIHKDAKLLMKTLLDNKRCINIYRKCYYCNSEESDADDSFIIYDNEEIEYFLNIKIDEYNDTQANIEYKFNYNNSKKSADVALLKNNELKYIFEICYKNKTKEENRPEPWFEIKAETLINETNTGDNVNEEGEIEIECIRDYKCVCCKDKEEYERKRHREIIEKCQIKEREQKLENNELLLMGKEDSRTIETKMKIEVEKENQRIEKEKQIKIIEEERELKRKKEEEERKEKIRKEKEEWKHSPYNHDKCGICNINYCKCLTRNFTKNEYHRTICNTCNKYKCMCVRITDFFKK
jgi:hypothetical protein